MESPDVYWSPPDYPFTLESGTLEMNTIGQSLLLEKDSDAIRFGSLGHPSPAVKPGVEDGKADWRRAQNAATRPSVMKLGCGELHYRPK